jgi:DNA-binding NarL/FixJ family response regulator
MLGRASEASLVESLVRDARGGVSGSLLVSGEPGIGKTLVLDHARSASDGMRLLETAGAEGESHLGFAGLSDLLGAVLHLVDELPVPQAIALRGALALGPPAPGDRFTAYAATLGLLATAAEEEPVLCIVDDAHWLDAESLEALLFVARRLGAEGIALILGARDDVSQRLEDAPLPRLRLPGLGRADAAELVARSSQADAAPPVVEALVAGAAGNPLALIEVASALTPSQLAGTDPLPDPLPVGPYLRDALLRPVLALPERTRRALLVASADDGAAGLLMAALATEGLGMADLEPAERAGVIAIGPTRARFSHPLVRAAVYQSADAPARRAAHRAHAASAGALGESALDRRAWHLALAATGPDEAVAADLEAAGGRAAARNGHAAACAAFESAARLSPDLVDRGRRLATAGQNALTAGEFSRAGGLFDEVLALDAEPPQVLQAMVGRGYVETFSGSARHAVNLLLSAADRAEPASESAAASLLIQATIPAVMRTDLGRAVALVARAAPLAASGPPALRAQHDVVASIISTLVGRPRDASPESVSELARQVASGDPTSFVWMMGWFQVLMFTERYHEAVVGLDRVIRSIRERSSPSALALPLFTRAEVYRRTGRLDEAAADAAESIRLAEDTGQKSNAGISRWVLARIEAVRGRGATCRSLTDDMIAAVAPSEASSLRNYADEALGLLALGEGRHDDATEHLSAVERRYGESDVRPSALVDAFVQDLIEALARVGRFAEAEEALAQLENHSRETATIWPAAAAARCRGLMAADNEFEAQFERALALHAQTSTPFERARTELCLGERRRRARRVREARPPLRAALEAFEALGAAPWAESARRELRAAGGRPRGPRTPTVEALTPQELQVALAVAEGATNKEAATALLISPKTIEYHLARVYAKLGVRSRAELAARIVREGPALLGAEVAD